MRQNIRKVMINLLNGDKKLETTEVAKNIFNNGESGIRSSSQSIAKSKFKSAEEG